MVHLSSARLVILEVSTGSFTTDPEVIAAPGSDTHSGGEDTQKFRSEASMEDIVSLLETTASAAASGSLAEPLAWAVTYMGVEGAVVLYRDEHDSVGMLASTGDLGELARDTGTLTALVVDYEAPATGTRVQQTAKLGENLLVASVGPRHVLVIRYSVQPPAIGDLRSIIAAVSIVLASARISGPAGSTEARMPSDEEVHATASIAIGTPDAPDLGPLADGELAPAREAFEAWMIRRALDATNGRQAEAARRLGLSRTGLFKKIRKLGILD
jgi:two-component system NtrC family response regulator